MKLARHICLVFFEIFALRFSAALGNMSKLYCTRLHENSAALGIARTSSALLSLARKFPCILVYLFTKNRLFYTFKNTPQRDIASSRANTMAKLPNVSHAS